jgi:GT2 family glycosyltransferase
MMDLTVVIVSYNVRHFLEQALQSVQRAIGDLAVEVIVVDNDSADDSVACVRQRFPWVTLIASAENVGFARANNQAMRQARGRYILLLNPDTVIEEDTFRKCLAFMDAHPDAGAMGVRMIDGGGRFLPESKRGFPTPWVAFCKAFGLSRLFPRSAFFNRYHLGYLDEHQVARVEVLSGAFMWMRKEALDRVGLLDDRFFMYGEDIDLSYRITQAEYHNYYFPEVTIIHYKGESTRKGTLNYIRIFYQAMILFAEKHFEGPWRTLYILFIRIAVYLRAGLSLLRSVFTRAMPGLIDAAIILGGVLLIKDFWAQYYFDDPDYYSGIFTLVNAPLYTGIWLLGLHFSGAWVRRYDLWTAARGVLMGTIALAAIYGFLETPYRTSRAIILLGAAWALMGTMLIRMGFHYLRFGKWWPGSESRTNLLIIGSVDECQRAEQLLKAMDLRKNLIGRVATSDTYDPALFLQHTGRLAELVHVFEVQEIIFCTRDIRAEEVMHWMHVLGPDLQYKTLPEQAQSFIGSASARTSGQLYTLDTVFRLSDPVLRRHKRTFDFLTGCALVLLAPVLFWWQAHKNQFLQNVWHLLTGRKTLVAGSYPFRHLPPSKPAMLAPEHAFSLVLPDEHTLRHLHYIYARDYSVAMDLRILLRNLHKLDRATQS